MISSLIFSLLMAGLLFAIKRLYFHPLSRYNGPQFWALTRLPYMLAYRSGQLAHKVKGFHEIYGETVRVGPNEISFINPQSVKDIYNKRPNAQFKSLPKDPVRQPPTRPGQPCSILEAGDEDHSRIRKAYATLFSTKALRAQEPLIVSYVLKMTHQLKGRASQNDGIVDLQKWFTYCVFDIICSLSFGEDFGCVENDRYHEWVSTLVFSLKAKVQLASSRYYPWLFNLLVKTMSQSAQAKFIEHKRITREKVQKRLEQHTVRPDFLSYLQASKHDLTEGEIVTNAETLITAGSHTLQTAVTGIVFQLLHNPETLSRVTNEIRDAFAMETDMDTKSLMQLPMLVAAIKEGMRLTSPVPLGLTRLVPDGGAVICGSYFPSGTVVSYMQWAANLSSSNYTDPTRFDLERWLDSDSGAGSRYNNDRKEANQPFLQGPRDCIGQNLAQSEIVLILGHLLYNFDITLPEGLGSQALNKWEDQETYAVWVGNPLPVHLRLRSGASRQLDSTLDNVSGETAPTLAEGLERLELSSISTSTFSSDSGSFNMSSSDGAPESWISSFCSLMGHEYFAEVSEDFIEDDFNLTGLQSQVPMYKEALEMILDVEPEDDEDEEEEEEEEDDDDELLGDEKTLGYRRAGDRRHMRVASDLSMIESSAELLYGLIHQRYITSRPGIQQMLEKYEVHHFGVCPRVNCYGCKVLPVGRTDTPGQETVKLFCPSCYDIYTPPNSRFQSVDGAFFGTTFGCLFFMTFPELDVGGRAESILSPASLAAGNTSNQSRSSSLNTSVALTTTSNTDQQPLANQPAQINGILTSNFAPGIGFGKIYEPRIYGFRVSERAKSGPRMQWLRMKPRDINELDESAIYQATHGIDDEGGYEEGDTEMGSTTAAASQQTAIGMRRKAPMRKRRHVPPSSTSTTKNGDGG